ncbi:mandelate racemase/muconate lactonizing enzyme family protein [Sporosarcina sp. Te-1]|uniref:mandelate racemase/muconate lactonizing enzyme family protein n=1 Tax=Sporosarcina sp. Te-1 TaxID=2818390 RepID=UPI001A9D50D5|nr:dipeptide epimerase [Sporosarcina sp. Te-1]QTD39996.1 dipeptide epimerase [Sporosarcina sp. Te-1]
MRIQTIEAFPVAVPLTKPFKTALRTVTTAHSIFVKLTCDDGSVGYGEAPPTHVITGDSMGSVTYAIQEVIAPQLIGLDISHREELFHKLKRSIVRNTSAKAAVDMAIHDLLGQHAKMPLYQLLGGFQNEIDTDFTVSVNDPAEMADDAASYVQNGFQVLKVKVGIGKIEEDIERIRAIRRRVGHAVKIRLDANQGWKPKEAVLAIGRMEDAGLGIELIEQPVLADDVEGLRYVTAHTLTPIMADESVFSAKDALRVLQLGAADLINIKLMKSGGIQEAMKINTLAEAFGVECMVGSMIETKLGITAAAHFAASQPNITRFDFDAPLMLSKDIVAGGIEYDGTLIRFAKAPGLGLDIEGMEEIMKGDGQ